MNKSKIIAVLEKYLAVTASEEIDGIEVAAHRILGLYRESKKKLLSPTSTTAPVEGDGEKEIMIQAFDKVRQLFEMRSWIMDGRGSYPYNDDRYKEEVRYMYDEFDALQKDTWANIESKTVDYRKKIIAQYLKEQPTMGVWVAVDYTTEFIILDDSKQFKCYVEKQTVYLPKEEINNDKK